MITNRKHLTCDEVRQFDFVTYLSGLGYEPVKIIRNDYWYLSPLRTEKTASFKVNRKLNRWYDFGFGIGGNIIDFAIRYGDCSIGEFLQSFQHNTTISQHNISTEISYAESKKHIKIIGVQSLSSLPLLRYLHTRNIPLILAEKYCKEIEFELYDRKHRSIGFSNDKGGYELRNSSFKSCSSPKAITIINSGSREVAVFEGFFDFLSWLVICNGEESAAMNFCILNSLSFFQGATAFLHLHEKIHLYLDHDDAGQNCRSLAQTISKKYIDESHLYKGYKDLNEWHVFIGQKSQKPN